MPRKPDTKKRAPKFVDSDSDGDSSMDSKGNIRNLIDYDYEESEDDATSDMFEMEETIEERTKRNPRRAAVNARKKMKSMMKKMEESDTSSDDDTYVPVKKEKSKRRVRPTLIVESESESEEEETTKRRKTKRRRSESTEESEEEEEDEDEDTDDDTDDTDDEDDDTDEEESEDERPRRKKRTSGGGAIDIVISEMLGGGGRDPNKPQKYNLKKEPQAVKRFVELVQKEEEEEDTIDNDITYFKSLTKEKQHDLLKVLEMKASPAEVSVPIKFKILEKVTVRPELNRIAMAKYNALCNIEPSSSEYYKVNHWITGFTNLPLAQYIDLPVKLEDGPDKCQEFMDTVNRCLDSAIYGHDEAKLQIMQFVSSWIANPRAHGNVMSIHGPPGVGKTSLIKDGVAKALGRPFHFITLGGATDASFLDGHSYTYEGSTWGKIVDVLIQSKCMNPVIYFDELDKVSQTPKGDEIMNLLIHLTDGSQNDRFQDKYFTGIDLDLSRCLFIFSHNNNELVNPILRDRMYNVAVKGFGLKEKLVISENYLLPAALKDAGLFEKVNISKDILQYVIENFTGGEAGVRELKRCIQTIVSKINLLRFYNNPKQVPFAIEGFSLPFIVKKSHIDLFLKKKEEMDASISHLYC
jgi:ATP-dependent Lon protease